MSRSQTMATAVLGGWIGLTLWMWFLAGSSFSTVDRVLRTARPEFAETRKPLGDDQARVVLRYLASEINRTCFRAYGIAQIVLAVALFLLLLRQAPRDTLALATAGGMLVLVLGLSLVLTPEMTSLGRTIDFLPRQPAPPQISRFRMLHAAFTGLDGLKLLAGVGLLLRGVWAR